MPLSRTSFDRLGRRTLEFFVVNRCNVSVEFLSSREQQVTQNTLIFLHFLVNSTDMLLQTALLREESVAQFTCKTNKLMNRLNVLSKTGTSRKRQFALQTSMHQLQMNRL